MLAYEVGAFCHKLEQQLVPYLTPEACVSAAFSELEQRWMIYVNHPLVRNGTTKKNHTIFRYDEETMTTERPKIERDIIEQVKRHVALGEAWMASEGGVVPKDTPEPPEPAFVPETPNAMMHAGSPKFRGVFGWEPGTFSPGVPADLAVPVFTADEWPEELRPFIPASLPNGGLWTWPKKATEELVFSMFAAGDRVLVHGPTGSGKSALVEAVAFMLQIPLVRVTCHRDMQSTDFLGKDIIKTGPTGTPVLAYDWSLTTLAAKFGGILLVDEAFRSPCLMAIQSLLERDGTLTLPDAASLTPAERKIAPPPGRSWIVLTDNTQGVGDESGSYISEVQDLSTLDRITAAVHVGYITPNEEQELLGTAFPKLPKSVAKGLTTWAAQMRGAFLERKVMQPISMRATLSIARKFMATGNLGAAVRLGYVSKLTSADALLAREAFHQTTGVELL